MAGLSNKDAVFELSVYLSRDNPGWASLLDSEGVPWSAEHDLSSIDPAPGVLILTRDTSLAVAQVFYQYCLQGATLIVEDGAGPGVELDGPIAWRLPYDREAFRGLESASDTRALIIERGKMGKGAVFCLPFDVQSLWSDWQRAPRFVSMGEGLGIKENMSAKVKKNLRRIIVEVIKQAFFCRDLPYAHKWFFPGKYRSVMSFRGDADGGPRENLLRWLDTVRPFAACTSIFFCTSQYAGKSDLITAAADAGLEVGSHNHWHIVFPDRLTNSRNLKRAEKKLTDAACRPQGFVAPAYFWHPSLYRLLEKSGYLYASSFRLSHDSLPYYPVTEGQVGRVLEFPFHCLGDRFSSDDLSLGDTRSRDFFVALIKKKYAAGEPMFIYGHPDMPGRMGTAPELVRMILETALSYADVKPWQLAAYADWWRQRNQSEIVCQYDRSSSRLRLRLARDGNGYAEDLMVRVEFANGETFLTDPAACPAEGLPRESLSPFESLQLPAPDAVGEVVYHGPDPPRSLFDWRARRTLQRFASAYGKAYLSGLSRSANPVQLAYKKKVVV